MRLLGAPHVQGFPARVKDSSGTAPQAGKETIQRFGTHRALRGNDNDLPRQDAQYLGTFTSLKGAPENCLFLMIIAPPILSATFR